VRQATISIANDDPDANPYTFAIQGTGEIPIGPGPVKPIPTLGSWAQMMLLLMLALIGGYGISARRIN